MFHRQITSVLLMILIFAFWCEITVGGAEATIRVGAARVDITPRKLPAVLNGNFQKNMAHKVSDPLYARAFVLAKGEFVMAFAVVDNCMIPQEICDRIKSTVHERTGIAIERILISATHCHSAPSLNPIFSTPVDEDYATFAPPKIAEAMILAYSRLQPAKIGSGFAFAPETVFCRRYVMREGTAWSLPPAFTGCEKNLAQMHPGTKGRMNGNALYPAGIPDPMVSILAAVTPDGKPITLFANFSSHYSGAPGISADFYGVFCNKIGEYLNAPDEFVPMLSNGACGDSGTGNPDNPGGNMHTVGEKLARAAFTAWKTIKFQDDLPINMIEETMTLGIRKPNKDQVGQAREWLKANAGKSRSTEYVFANETIGLDAMPPTKTFKIQAIRLGDLAIAAVPVQPYAWTSHQLRRSSPFPQTFIISLANGTSGYIPPAHDFELGGYSTWRVRTNCLEKGSEVKVREKLLDMFRKVAMEKH